MSENNKKDPPYANEVKKYIDFEKDLWNKYKEFEKYEEEIDQILDKKLSDSQLLLALGFFATSLSNIGRRINEKTVRLQGRIRKQLEWCSEEKALETFDADHTIPLQEENPLRDAIGIDERWVLTDNANSVDKWIKSSSNSMTDSSGVIDMDIYEKLKAFINDQKVGRGIHSPWLCLDEYPEEHVHPLSFLNRPKEDNSDLCDFGDWKLIFYNKEIGDQLQIDHEFEFEFGFLSIPYAKPLPEGVHRVALLQRKGRKVNPAILEVTVQAIPFKFWHPRTNAWLAKIQIAKNI